MVKVKEINDFRIIAIKKKELEVELMNYGATIYGIKTKDYLGNMQDIVLKYENIDDYLNNNIYLNATIGPIAGRVKDAIIKTDDKVYELDKNSDNLHTLHSGSLALSYKWFDYEVNEEIDYTEVVFLYEEEELVNYQVKVIYRVFDNKIEVMFEVDTDQDFVFNLTNHAYFNLSGNLSSNIRDHQVLLNSDLRHELNDELVITGKVIKENGIYNFKDKQDLNLVIKELEKTPKGGVDDIYYFPNNDLRHAMAVVYEPLSNRMMKVRSSYDHLVFYTHNNINDLELKHLGKHKWHYALCFECQKSPYGFKDKDCSNPLLKKNQTYQEKIIFEFSIK
ncbi:MAG: hypothetical protein RQ856_00210 [Candidatus Izemoplasmatales bacterium]|nr:hypothetical protein [Candidatus Izemoplasmatales bacterium]